MFRFLLLACAAGCLVAVGPAVAGPPIPADQHAHTDAPAGLSAPESIHAEHQKIHAALDEAMNAPGAVGAAAKALMQVLQPHFEREEQIALPPLGLLAPLARGEQSPHADEALRMADTLRREMPKMLEEHEAIRARVQALATAARTAKAPRHEQFAEALALHARTEEEVLYPAAMLVGDVIRARSAAR